MCKTVDFELHFSTNLQSYKKRVPGIFFIPIPSDVAHPPHRFWRNNRSRIWATVGGGGGVGWWQLCKTKPTLLGETGLGGGGQKTLDELQRSQEKKFRYALVTKFVAISSVVGSRNMLYKRGLMTQKNASRCGKDGATIINSGKLKVVRRRSFFFLFPSMVRNANRG